MISRINVGLVFLNLWMRYEYVVFSLHDQIKFDYSAAYLALSCLVLSICNFLLSVEERPLVYINLLQSFVAVWCTSNLFLELFFLCKVCSLIIWSANNILLDTDSTLLHVRSHSSSLVLSSNRCNNLALRLVFPL